VTGVVRNVAVRQRAAIPENAGRLTVFDLSTPQIEFRLLQAYYNVITVGMLRTISYKGTDYQGVVATLSSNLARGKYGGRVRFADLALAGLRRSDSVELRLPFEKEKTAF
jgi:hypothetical protein